MAEPDVLPCTFAEAAGLTPAGAGHFTAEVHPEWTIGGKPNGGYLLAMLGAAAQATGPHPHVIAASAHYLHSPDPGRVAIEADVLRAGRTASQLRVRLVQDGRGCVEALITTSTLDPANTPYWSDGMPRPGTVAQADCPRLAGQLPSGHRAAIMDQVDLRLEPASFGYRSGQPTGRGELRGWLALPDGEAFDVASLLYAVDAFPPATFDIQATGWVPTLELTCYVRALPAPGPVQILQRAQLIEDQRVDEVCHVWDSTGRLVAHGSQLAGVRLG